MDLGLSGLRERMRQPPPVRDLNLRAGSRWTFALVLVLVLGVIAAMASLMLSALSARPAVSLLANAFASRAFAINRFGYDAAHVAWYDGGLSALQVAAYETVTGALRRYSTVVVAAREAMTVASVLAAVALTVGARRLRLSAPAVVAVPLLFGLTPAALVLHRTTDPVQLGVLWASVALALAAGGAGRSAAVACGVCLGLAAASSPLVLIALVPLFAMLVWSGSLGRLDRRGRIGAAAAGLVVFGVLVVLAAADRLPGGGAAVLPGLGPLDWALGLAALGAGVGGLWVGWLRPFATALLATAFAAAVAPDLRASLVLVALPFGAIVLPGAVEAAAVALGRRHEPWLQGRIVVGGALAAAAALAWLPTADTVRMPVDGSRQTAVTNARSWVFANLPSHPKLLVDDAMWACLVKSDYPTEQLVAASGIGPARAAWPWAEARYVISGKDTLVGVTNVLAAAGTSSIPVASFSDGTAMIIIHRLLTDPDAAAHARRQEAERLAAGRQLATNPRLDMQPKAATLVRSGRVDSRALAVLAAATGQHELDLVDFPVVPGEDPVFPRRLIAVSAVDHYPVQAGSPGVVALDRWLRVQQPPYRPAGVQLDALEGNPVLLIQYDALGDMDPLPR